MEIDSTEFIKSLETGFVSRSVSSNSFYTPTLLYNNWLQGKKILSSISSELETCTEFLFSVAFITSSGLASLLQILDTLQKRNVPGKIITTNYLNFTDPAALEKLLEFSNIELRAYTDGGFHPKGYIFKQTNYYSMIIGSANLTQDALSRNHEWSVRFLSCTDGQIIFTVKDEFERIWEKSKIVCRSWIDDYSQKYKKQKKKWLNLSKETTQELGFEVEIEANTNDEIKDELEIVPNKMQEEAMRSLINLRKSGKKKALLIAATGTGKTYLAAFDVKQFRPKRLLYVAHRDVILSKSEKSFRYLTNPKDTGFLTGTKKDFLAQYLFASIFTLAKDDVLHSFSKETFDYIIIDEVHHAGASSYKKILDYFQPQFCLGLTATPERTDGFDIFEMFDHNLAYEIRLQKALEEDLLCPFHYYGISDLTVDGEIIEEKSDFSKLVATERIRHIKEALLRFKNNSFPVKGLIFCSRKDEAKELTKQLNKNQLVAKCLLSDDSDFKREQVIEELEDDHQPLQYIVSVDIFNEGVDILSVNQVVMLRPTQSAIIFIQQLGRGLRKAENKPYVSVIDFIGNYENNFFIPIALYGNYSYDKDSLRKCLATGSANIPGASTIQITEIARQKIFDSLSKANFTQLKLLKTEYEKLKRKLAKIPLMMDFVRNDGIDPYLFIEKSETYFQFKMKIEKELPIMTESQLHSLQFVSKELGKGIRIHELLLLKLLMQQSKISIKEFQNQVEKFQKDSVQNSFSCTENDLQGVIRVLSDSFYGEFWLKKQGPFNYVFLQNENIIRGVVFERALKSDVYRQELNDLINYGLSKLQLKENERILENNFILYRKYTRKDVCKLLNWKKDYTSTIYGYKTDKNTKVCPIFVTYKKAENISDTIDYDDHFLDDTRFNWMTRSNRTIFSSEVEPLIEQEKSHMRIMLFIQKDKTEDFYYLGDMKYAKHEETFLETKEKKLPIVNIQFDMKYPVRQDIYHYLETNIEEQS